MLKIKEYEASIEQMKIEAKRVEGEERRKGMEMESEVALLKKEYDVLRESHTNTLNQFQKDFHGVWGAIGKTGYINSRFANQIGRFACLYTSHVGNLSYYSPNKSYRALQDELPHDGIIE